jgi:uncharacterized MAPEG superfamily protein
MVLGSALLRAKFWTPAGFRWSFGNRDTSVDSTAIAGRAERAARNMLENMVLFVAVLLAASLSGHATPQAREGATLFLWARLVYWPIYLVGVPYLRTAVWAASTAGLVMIATAAIAA